MASRFGLVLMCAAFGCTKPVFEAVDGHGGAGGSAGDSGAGGVGAEGGLGGSVAGTSGAAGSIGGGAGGGAGASGAGGDGAGGSAGAGGRGGSGGVGATGGGTGGTAGAGGGAGRGGTGGSAGGGGSAGSGGTGGSAGGGGTAGTGGTGGVGGTPMGMTPWLAGQIVITELMHNSAGLDDNLGEWFEVYNPSTTITFDLLGCQISDGGAPGPASPFIDKNLVLAPMSFKTLAVSASPGFTPNFVYTPPGMEANPPIKFNNQAGDGAQIFCGGVMIDAFLYPTSLAAGAGHSFSVDPAHYNAVDNDSMANWCVARDTMAGDAYEATGPNYGTPGRANTPCP
jgi:hypothetical protein